MTDTIETETITEPTQPKRTLSSRRKATIVTGLVLLIAGGLSAWSLAGWQPGHGPFPKNTIAAITFAPYYPRTLPAGYTLQKDSMKTDAGVLSFQLRKHDQDHIELTEQSLPPTPLDLGALKDRLQFSDLTTPAGQAIVGMREGKPAAIVLTKSSVLTVEGTEAVSLDTIRSLATSLIPY